MWVKPIIVTPSTEEWEDMRHQNSFMEYFDKVEKENAEAIHINIGMVVMIGEEMVQSSQLQKLINLEKTKPMKQNHHAVADGVFQFTYSNVGQTLTSLETKAQKVAKLSDDPDEAQAEMLTYLKSKCTAIYAADIGMDDTPITEPQYGGINLFKLKSVVNVMNDIIAGVTQPMLYMGTARTVFCIHWEDLKLYSVNTVLKGEPKTWFWVIPEDTEKARDILMEYVKEKMQNAWADNRYCPNYIQHKCIYPLADIFLKQGIRVGRYTQTVGETMFIPPGVFHWGFNHGLNYAWSVNFATFLWIPYAETAISCVKPCPRGLAAVRMDIPVLRSTATYLGYNDIDSCKDLVTSIRRRIQHETQKFWCDGENCNWDNCDHVDHLPTVSEDMMEIVRLGLDHTGDHDTVITEMGKECVSRRDMLGLAVDTPVPTTVAYAFLAYLKKRGIDHGQNFIPINYLSIETTHDIFILKDCVKMMPKNMNLFQENARFIIFPYYVNYSKKTKQRLERRCVGCLVYIGCFIADLDNKTLEQVESEECIESNDSNKINRDTLKIYLETQTGITAWTDQPNCVPVKAAHNDWIVAVLRYLELLTRVERQTCAFDSFDLRTFRKFIACTLLPLGKPILPTDFFLNPEATMKGHTQTGSAPTNPSRYIQNKWKWCKDEDLGQRESVAIGNYITGFGNAPENLMTIE